MEIILLQDIQSLGSKDDLVTVKDGYGRNFLIPSKMAIVATESAKKVLAENIRQRAHKEAKLKDEALAIAEKLQNKQVVIATKTSATGKIFGSVNTIQLAEAINKKGFEIDRKQIKIAEDSIKEIGKYTAKIKLHKEVVVDFDFGCSVQLSFCCPKVNLNFGPSKPFKTTDEKSILCKMEFSDNVWAHENTVYASG